MSLIVESSSSFIPCRHHHNRIPFTSTQPGRGWISTTKAATGLQTGPEASPRYNTNISSGTILKTSSPQVKLLTSSSPLAHTMVSSGLLTGHWAKKAVIGPTRQTGPQEQGLLRKITHTPQEPDVTTGRTTPCETPVKPRKLERRNTRGLVKGCVVMQI